MKKSALDKLLIKIDNFIKLAAPVQDSSEFKEILSRFLNLSISDEEFNTWLEENSFFDKISLYWGTSIDKYDTYLEASEFSIDDVMPIYRIYKSPLKNKDDFILKEETMLKSSGTIPALYYYRLNTIISSGLENLDKKYMKYFFIAEALSKIFDIPLNQDFNKKFEHFLHQNASTINKIMSEVKSFPKLLGAGSDGAVFDTGDGQVLKLFKQKFALDKAIEAINLRHSQSSLARTEAIIKDAGLFGLFENNPMYYYIIEKMQPVTSLSQEDQIVLQTIVIRLKSRIIDEINSGYWDDIKEMINDPKDHNLIKSKVTRKAKALAALYSNIYKEKINNFPMKLGVVKSWLELLCEEIIMKVLTGREDLDVRNLGINSDGEFRYFDPSFDFSKISYLY